MVQTGAEAPLLNESQRAELDSSTKLPGLYVKPHPGEDGKYGTGDDRSHIGQGIVIPICSQEAIDADANLTDVRADRSAVANCYNSNPPSSGPMTEQTGGFRVYENPVPKEATLHSMEHGGVVVWYNSGDESIKKRLESVVKDELDRRRKVVMTPYTGMEADTIAITSWSRLEKFPAGEFTEKRVRSFIEAHQNRFTE